jgi:hypothetical protein
MYDVTSVKHRQRTVTVLYRMGDCITKTWTGTKRSSNQSMSMKVSCHSYSTDPFQTHTFFFVIPESTPHSSLRFLHT